MIQHLLAYLLNASWQVTLVALAAWALWRLLRPAPAQGSRFWLVAYALAVLAPLAAMLAGNTAVSAARPAVLAKFSLVQGVTVAPWLATLLGYAFFACLALACLRLLAGVLVARRLIAQSEDLTLTPDLQASLSAFCANRGHRLPQIRSCARISSPLVIGLWRPCVLVPPGVAEQGDGALRAALLHELAHVVRHDQASNTLVEIFALPLTWHPALHLLKRMVALTREQSCDAMAAAQIGCRHLYADTLLSLARRAIAPMPHAAIGMLGEGDLPSRIVLLATGARPRLPRFAAAAACGLFLILGAVVVTVHVAPLAPVTALPPMVRGVILPGLSPSRQVAIAHLARNETKPVRRRAHGGTDRLIGFSEQRPTPRPDILVLSAVPEMSSGDDGALDFLLPLSGRYRTIAP